MLKLHHSQLYSVNYFLGKFVLYQSILYKNTYIFHRLKYNTYFLERYLIILDSILIKHELFFNISKF